MAEWDARNWSSTRTSGVLFSWNAKTERPPVSRSAYLPRSGRYLEVPPLIAERLPGKERKGYKSVHLVGHAEAGFLNPRELCR